MQFYTHSPHLFLGISPQDSRHFIRAGRVYDPLESGLQWESHDREKVGYSSYKIKFWQKERKRMAWTQPNSKPGVLAPTAGCPGDLESYWTSLFFPRGLDFVTGFSCWTNMTEESPACLFTCADISKQSVYSLWVCHSVCPGLPTSLSSPCQSLEPMCSPPVWTGSPWGSLQRQELPILHRKFP